MTEQTRHDEQRSVPRWIAGYVGKARPMEDWATRSHPLAYHALDVAASMERLLAVRPGLARALARVSGLTTEVAKSWAILAAGLHDLGKFVDGFQAKLQADWPGRGAVQNPAESDHAAAGVVLWRKECRHPLSARVRDKPAPFAHLLGGDGAARRFRRWLAAAAGHHGRPVGHFCGGGDNVSAESCEDAAAFVEGVFNLFQPGLTPDADDDAPAEEWLVAGLVTIADWIGSDKDVFRYELPDRDLESYWPLAQERAGRAVSKSGLGSSDTSRDFTLLDALGRPDSVAAPTPLQDWAARVDVPDRPCLALLEDLTGSGKTEAALLLAHRMMVRGLGGGLYWALPTQATANALFSRLSKSYRALYGDAGRPSLGLAHAATDLVSDFGAIVRDFSEVADPGADEKPLAPSGEEEDETGSALCSAWLASERRKVFLAEVGVGTIDQALMGALATKFQALRLAALADRILIIDEAHSYDGYTSRLMEGLVAFHAALGGSVIVLSATLSTTLKERLLSAYRAGRDGRGWRGEALVKLRSDAPFPLATLDAPNSQGALSPPVEEPCVSKRGTRRDLPVRRLTTCEEALAVVLGAAREERCAVWVRNTVQDAIDAYELVRDAAADSGAVDLFHARFTLGDRRRIEENALSRFGKKPSKERAGRILIATQVVEQSLDLDFDVMVSDLAPLDYLIQRAGRLQRHERNARPAPELCVLGPDPYGEIKADWYEVMFRHAQYVYPDHAALWRTMKLLLDQNGLKLESASPRELIEAVYREDAWPGDEGPVPPALRNRADEAAGRGSGEKAAAVARLLDVTDGYTRDARAWMDDERAPTRLGDEQRVVRLARWNGAELEPWAEDSDRERAWRLSEIQLPLRRALCHAGTTDAALEAAIAAEEASWGRRGRHVLLLPLRETPRHAWVGDTCGRSGDGPLQTFRVSYDKRLGLRYGSR